MTEGGGGRPDEDVAGVCITVYESVLEYHVCEDTDQIAGYFPGVDACLLDLSSVVDLAAPHEFHHDQSFRGERGVVVWDVDVGIVLEVFLGS